MVEQKEQKSISLKSELTSLGFASAAVTVDRKREIARKMAIAFEHYRVVTPENIDQFNKKLKRKTLRMWWECRRRFSTWQSLKFTDIGSYTEIPPIEVREALGKAKELKCFDSFEVATLKDERNERYVAPDPILFGTITGCENKYFIAQWDEDVAIEDILKDGEG